MNYLIEGILFGLTLTILLGPIFVALTQTGIEKGTKAGITVGSGVWTSDVLIMAGAYFFVSKINSLLADKVFTYWMGLIGGFILITFGIAIFLSKVKEFNKNASFTAKNYFGFWLKGFLVNTVNPFTFIFWIGVITTYVIGRKISNIEAFIFLGSIIFTIIVTDIAKVLLAKVIRNKLTPRHLLLINRVAGVALAIFGVVLLWKSSEI